MANILPKIDNRDQQDLVANLRRLILEYCPEWGSVDDIAADKQLDALVNIFSNMMGHVIERLNQAPEKHFISFLNLVGISPTPPRVAKVPLVFKLKEDSISNGYVPSGSKVSAKPENQAEIVFETEKDITVIKPKLVRAVSIDPRDDSWTNQDFLFAPEPTGKAARIFGGDLPVSHRLYIGNSKLLNFSEATNIHLDIHFIPERFNFPQISWNFLGEDSSSVDLEENAVAWYYLDKDNNPVEIKLGSTINPEDPLKYGDPLNLGMFYWYYMDRSDKPFPIKLGSAIKTGDSYWYYMNDNKELILLGDFFNCGRMSWFCFDKEGNPISIISEQVKENILIGMKISFSNVKGITSNTISGYDKNRMFRKWKNNWVFAQLNTALVDSSIMPDIEFIKVGIDVSPDKLLPDGALFNYSKLDISKDFLVFGERPVFNDTFYIASRDAFSKKDAFVKIKVDLSNENSYPVPDPEYVRLFWEYWDGTQWKLLIDTSRSRCVKEGGLRARIDENEITDKNVDNTIAFTTSGTIEFVCPEIKPFTIDGEENYWIRARIIEGDYGKDGYLDYQPKTVKIQNTDVELTDVEYIKPSFRPPSVKAITIGYSVEEFPEEVITENNFIFTDRHYECITENVYFKPFSPCTDCEPAFYMAFDQDISALPISLFFPLTGSQIGEDPIVAWEYWNGRRWVALSVNDSIRHFTLREIIQFVAPSDVKSIPLFGSEYYWIRARLEDGGYKIYPHIAAIYQNAVWAKNHITISGEILGSSNGEPEQTFQLTRFPVLSGQSLYVRETLAKGEWINWQEVKTFSLSLPDSRHYMLDHTNGAVIFGDGNNGMIPPAGIENIKCDYLSGGGVKGNAKAGSVVHMWDSCADIDSVNNPVSGDGGFEQEDPEQAKIRGPYTLKSRDRGVTCEDIEWMVREAMPQIAKVKCFPTMDQDLKFKPGKATVIVAPNCEDPKPAPSQELLGEIYAYLSKKTPALITGGTQQRINVIGPDYIRVGVEANVTYKSTESVKIIEGRIIENLKQFFDPLKGGDENMGWDFGRNLYVSEVYSVIKNTPGVDYITDLSVKSSVQSYTLILNKLSEGYYKPLVLYPKHSAVKSNDNRIMFSLAQALPAKEETKNVMVKGFRENDIIKLRYGNRLSKELIIVSVSGDMLECQTIDEEPLDYDYPVGSDIEAKLDEDLTIRSYILNSISGLPVSFFIKIAVLEPGDTILLSRADEYTNTTPLKICEVRSEDVFLEEDELIYSGVHLINSKPQLKFPYLIDTENGVVHDLSNTSPECCLKQIKKDSRVYVENISSASGAKMCKYCFPVDIQ